jgi:hypothetical protein
MKKAMNYILTKFGLGCIGTKWAIFHIKHPVTLVRFNVNRSGEENALMHDSPSSLQSQMVFANNVAAEKLGAAV